MRRVSRCPPTGAGGRQAWGCQNGPIYRVMMMKSRRSLPVVLFSPLSDQHIPLTRGRPHPFPTVCFGKGLIHTCIPIKKCLFTGGTTSSNTICDAGGKRERHIPSLLGKANDYFFLFVCALFHLYKKCCTYLHIPKYLLDLVRGTIRRQVGMLGLILSHGHAAFQQQVTVQGYIIPTVI